MAAWAARHMPCAGWGRDAGPGRETGQTRKAAGLREVRGTSAQNGGGHTRRQAQPKTTGPSRLWSATCLWALPSRHNGILLLKQEVVFSTFAISQMIAS